MAKAKQNRPAGNLSGEEELTLDVEQGSVEASEKDMNALDRALMHLSFLERELRALTAHKSDMIGPMLRTAARHKQQFDGDVAGWPPLKLIKAILDDVKKQVSS